MKKIILILSAILISVNIFAIDQEELSPTAVPRIPVVEYTSSNHHIWDLMAAYVEFDDTVGKGVGFGYNYVNYFPSNYGFNVAAGFMYLNAEEADDFELHVWTTPIAANFAYQYNSPKENLKVSFFGGMQWAYYWMDFYLEGAGMGFYVHGYSISPQAGVVLNYKVNENLEVIPFYLFNLSIYDMEVEYNVNGTHYVDSVNMDDVASHIIGFDIKYKGTSIGAIFDTFKTGKVKQINIRLSHDFGGPKNSDKSKTD